MDNKQDKQDSQYNFPYHYLPTLIDGKFELHKTLYWGYEYLSYIELIVSLISKKRFEDLLDIGCGDGRLIYELSNMHTDKKFTGIDYSEKPLFFARAFNYNKNNVDFFKIDISKENYIHQHDVVTLIEVIEHIEPPELQNFIDKTINQIKKGGELLLTAPTNNIPTTSKHYQHFNYKKIEKLFGEKITINKVVYLNSTSSSAKFLERLFSNRLFVLQHQKIKNWLFQYYKKHYLICRKNDGSRILVTARK